MTSKHTALSFLLFVQPLITVGQDTLSQTATRPAPYQLSWKTDGAMAGIIAMSGVASSVLEQQVRPFTGSDLSHFERSQVNAFDRGATYNWSPDAYRISDQTLTANFVVTGLLALPTLFHQKNWVNIPVMYIEVLAAPTLIQQTAKNIVLRTRPYVYNPDAPQDPKLAPNARQSFFRVKRAYRCFGRFCG